jgi:hypothetical protein
MSSWSSTQTLERLPPSALTMQQRGRIVLAVRRRTTLTGGERRSAGDRPAAAPAAAIVVRGGVGPRSVRTEVSILVNPSGLVSGRLVPGPLRRLRATITSACPRNGREGGAQAHAFTLD